MDTKNIVKSIKTCSCCCRDCYGAQWWNRDKGYGLCSNCVPKVFDSYLRERFTHEEALQEMKDCYGVDGRHYFSNHDLSMGGLDI